ncbi:hypothetical protein [Pseudomonas mangiferae]|uniref:Uncharacterized protein n=1 Tax=Pseudomonas mangiferae TaxID=2593654 RepID=A0A553GUC2_9PSED|nr:hypothetical protein [Pseudomonas mangiferae]TRX73081.1 hypothetical protein FM069_19330 [Pseudomonas mangiferae]
MDFLKLLKGCIFTIFLAFFLGVWILFEAPKSSGVADLKRLEEEFVKIHPPAYSYQSGEKHASSKVSSGLVQQFYLTKMAEVDVKDFYEKQLLANGWRESPIESLTEWTYCKGRLRAEISPQAKPSGYTFSISWFSQNTSGCP